MVSSVGGIDYTQWQGTSSTLETAETEDTNTSIFNENSATTDSNYSALSDENKLEANKGLFNKIRHLFTGKDYYKTSTGVKVSTDSNTGAIYETEDGSVYVEGAQNATIKGTKGDDDITVISSDVKKINGKKGDDNIYVANSDVGTIKGGKGDDDITVYNSYVDKIKGNRGADEIYAEDSNINKINGGWGKDTVVTDGGYVKIISSTFRDNVEIKNNPLNHDPNLDYSFEA